MITAGKKPIKVKMKITNFKENRYLKKVFKLLLSVIRWLSFPISSKNAAAAQMISVVRPMLGNPPKIIIPTNIRREITWFKQSTFQAATVPIKIAKNIHAASALYTARYPIHNPQIMAATNPNSL